MYWVIAALAVALLPQLTAMTPLLIVLTLAPLAWRALAEARRWKPLPLLLRLTLTATVLATLFATYGNPFGRRTAVSLLAMMLALKLLETFRTRDARIVASLSLFLCATQFLFSQRLPMIFYGAACMVTSLVAFGLLAREQAFAGVRKPTPPGPGLLSELKASARLLALALPVGLTLFLLFPRWGSPLWGIPERSLDARTGLSDSMTPGSIQDLFMDDSPAFRVDFSTPLPSRSELYWRGPVFWNFDGRTWTENWTARRNPAEKRADVAGADHRYTVQLEPMESRWLFALDYPALVPERPKSFLTLDQQLITGKPVTNVVRYAMASDTDFLDAPTLSSTRRGWGLQLPEGFNPRARELIATWRAESRSDAAIVRRALDYFRAQDFRYTLNPPLLTRHSVDEFLFETREGFCEHYASAFTVMMRMAGIPARVVTGYQGGWYNEMGSYLLVRQSDAHAWSEVWLPGVGWTRIDPTAAVSPSRIEQGSLDALDGRRFMFDFGWVREVRNSLDWMGRTWNDWVIAFDAGRQNRLLELAGLARYGRGAMVIMMLASFAVVSGLLLPWLLRLRDRRHGDPALRSWRNFQRRLARAGTPVTPAMGPLELATVAGSRMDQQRDEIRHIADLYLRLRYAREGLTEGPVLHEFRSAVRRFRARRP